MKPSSMRTPLSRVLHLGSARSGTDHFWMERVTGAASLVLTVAAIVIALMVAGRPYEEAVAVLGSPVAAAILVLFVVAVVMHMKIGMEAIIIDYVHGEAGKVILLILNTFFSIAVAAVAIFAILGIAFGG